MKTKGILYYTDFNADPEILRVCLERIKQSFDGDTVSVSLKKPVELGKNIVINAERGYVAMMQQIITGLKTLTTDYVFFVEHDVLYNKSHFDFIPPRDDIFFYNSNVWRWKIGSDKAIRHDRMIPLSAMCCNRKLALRFYQHRMDVMKEAGLDIFANDQSALMRRWGFEPGTKKKRRGGLTDDDFDTWKSKDAIIDIRHKGTFSPPKCTLDSFKHAPKNWETKKIEQKDIWN